jgi:CHAD domain-containing protein
MAAWPVKGITPASTYRDAAGRTILTRWREMMSYRDGTLAGEDIEELHDMRVSSRRLRAAMDAFAGAFPDASFRRNLKVVKRVTDTLGAARDLDVAIEHLRELAEAMDDADRPGVEGLIARYRAERGGETVHIARLFERLERDGFGDRFERWIATHTGVTAKKLRPGPA